jgi:hypothetical protein
MMTLTEDQTMLQDSVAPFMAAEGAIKTQLRHWRDTGAKMALAIRCGSSLPSLG